MIEEIGEWAQNHAEYFDPILPAHEQGRELSLPQMPDWQRCVFQGHEGATPV